MTRNELPGVLRTGCGLENQYAAWGRAPAQWLIQILSAPTSSREARAALTGVLVPAWAQSLRWLVLLRAVGGVPEQVAFEQRRCPFQRHAERVRGRGGLAAPRTSESRICASRRTRRRSVRGAVPWRRELPLRSKTSYRLLSPIAAIGPVRPATTGLFVRSARRWRSRRAFRSAPTLVAWVGERFLGIHPRPVACEL